MVRYDIFITSGDSRGGVGPRNTHFYSYEGDLIPEIHDGRFFTLHRTPFGIIIQWGIFI